MKETRNFWAKTNNSSAKFMPLIKHDNMLVSCAFTCNNPFFSFSICSVRLKKSWKSSAYDKIEIKTVRSLMTEQTNDHVTVK